MALLLVRLQPPLYSDESDEVVTLESGAPASAPLSLSLSLMDPRRVTVRWTPPRFPNAHLLSYEVKLNKMPKGYNAVKVRF